MIFISILFLIVAIALPSINNQISSLLFSRITVIILFYAGALTLNALYIQSIGSGIGIYNGYFNVTLISQFFDSFLFIIGGLILVCLSRNNVVLPTGRVSSASGLINLAHGDFATRAKHTLQWVGVNHTTEYSLVIIFSTLGASLLVSSSDLISMYLSIELQSFAVYVLATLYKDSESATSAGLKYFLLGGLSSCIILLGTGLIYSYTGLTNFDSIHSLISVTDVINYTGEGAYNNVINSTINILGTAHLNVIEGFILGLIIMLVGLLFKVSAAPLHNWAPDVYDDSPTVVTIWLTIMPKISIFILLLETMSYGLSLPNMFLSFGFESAEPVLNAALSNEIVPNIIMSSASALPDFSNLIKNLLLLSSLLSLIIGTVVGLAQTKIKRLLAYSTISHVGFLLLALSIYSEQSIEAFLFYIIQYTITNLNTFLIIIALGSITYSIISGAGPTQVARAGPSELIARQEIKLISELKGQFFFNPILSLSLVICLFSMAGVPPLIGFFSKQFVLSSAILNGNYFMAILAIVVSLISASYYLKIIRTLYSDYEQLLETQPITISLPPTPNTPLLSYSLSGKESVNSINNTDIKDNISTNLSAQLNQHSVSYRITHFHSYLISILTLIILLFIFKSSIILNSAQLLALSLFYY